jgi:exoribonuclease II
LSNLPLSLSETQVRSAFNRIKIKSIGHSFFFRIGHISTVKQLHLFHNMMTSLRFQSDLPKYSVVIFDKDSTSVVAVAVDVVKGKHIVLTETGKRLELSSARLKSIGHRLAATDSQIQLLNSLRDYKNTALETVGASTIKELWDFSSEESTELSEEELSVMYFGENKPHLILGLRVRLVEDNIYFKRGKRGFIPRDASAVEQVKKAKERATETASRRDLVTSTIKSGISRSLESEDGKNGLTSEERLTIVQELKDLALYAAWGDQWDSPRAKDTKQLLIDLKSNLGPLWDKVKLRESFQQNDDAFALLLALGIFTPHENLALIRHRPLLEWSPEALEEAARIAEVEDKHQRINLTHIESFTIDDSSTMDMDDAFSLIQTEQGFQLGIHITDVASVIPIDEDNPCALDQEARLRASSIYCPDLAINMLPNILSEEKLSLCESKIRPCLSLLFELDHQLKVVSWEFVRTLIRSAKKYTYDEADALLDEEHPPFTLLTLSQIAANREAERVARGATNYNRKEVSITVPSIPNERPILKSIDMNSPARSGVAEMMILYNFYAATFAFENKLPFPYRTQPTPDENPEVDFTSIPEGPAREFSQRIVMKRSELITSPDDQTKLGHSSLGLPYYSQATSPIRRYMDLCCQRQIIAFIEKKPLPYSIERINEVHVALGEPLTKVQLVNRESKRYWLLEHMRYMMREKEHLSAVVVRNDARGTLVEVEDFGFNHPIRLNQPPALGAHITLEITGVHPRSDLLRLRAIK